MKKNIKKIISIISSIIIIAIIAIVIIINNIPSFHSPKPFPKTRICFSNIRVILGAVEMYNLDHSEMMQSLDLDKLYKNGYLKSEIIPSTKKCKYLSEGDLTGDGYVYCEEHGDVEQKYKITQERE